MAGEAVPVEVVDRVKLVTLFQHTVPAGDKPGFFAAMQALLTATFSVASLTFGFLGDVLSPQTLCLIQAAGFVPVALALLAVRRREPVPAVVGSAA
ncbi:hypothetical protein [Couchioplanes caeruleus]|uniref:hypothetical protein n=1 Tax=Couchioplanes caeruleus TaxID=56438 RepID=UPI001FD216D9|nr:hypothetical protein [Couchioplanes caeruleus]